MKKKIFAALFLVIFIFAAGLFLNGNITQNITVTAQALTEGNFTYEVSNGEATITDYPESATGEVIIPETLGGYPVKSIGYRAFEDCCELTSIKIPDSVTSIGDYAFCCCTNLTSIKLSDSLTTIGADAFACCGKLTSIKLPDTLTNIGGGAFSLCGLTSVKIPNSVTNIGGCAFGCSALTSIELPNSITNISSDTFLSCRKLTEITIPDNVTTICDSAFYECGLTSVKIGKNVSNIGDYAFSYCTGLTNIRYSGTDWDNFVSIGGLYNLMTYGSSSKHLYLGSETNETTSIVIDSATSISEYAFSGCTGLTSIEIGDNVTSIGNSAFSGCSSLKEVTFKNKETEIPFNDTTIPVSTVINCLHNSTAYKYALSFNREYVLTDEHNYNLKLSLPAGCASYGFNIYECACGAEKNETIIPTGHTEAVDKAVAATCTKTGLTEGKHCSVCKAVLVAQKEVKALGHDWDDGEITTPATATETGVKTYTCTRENCGATKAETVAKLAVTKVNAKAATNTTAGNTEYYICNGKYYLDAACTKETTLAAVTIPVIKQTFTYGDVDKDGKITAADARLALRASVGLEKYSAGSDKYNACDVDADGKITAADARLILRASVGLEDEKKFGKK